MSEVGGKKFLVIAPEEYELMVKNNSKKDSVSSFNNSKLLEPPEKVALHQSNEKIQNVWDRRDLEEDEKVRLFMEEFKKFKTYYDQLSRPKVVEIRSSNNSERNEYLDASSSPFLDGLGKNHKATAQKLMKHLEEHGGESVKWNKNSGELVYNGITLPASNITDLLKDVVSAGKRQSSNPQHLSTFVKALEEIDVPLSLVKNPKSLSLMRAYKKKDEQENNVEQASPMKKKKTVGTPLKPNNWKVSLQENSSPVQKKPWVSSTRTPRIKR